MSATFAEKNKHYLRKSCGYNGGVLGLMFFWLSLSFE